MGKRFRTIPRDDGGDAPRALAVPAFLADSAQPDALGNALSGGCTVYPLPQLFAGGDSTHAGGHGWVLPRRERTEEQAAAVQGDKPVAEALGSAGQRIDDLLANI